MKILVQRVLSANVKVQGKTQGSITQGLLMYICFEQGDNQEVLKFASEKIANLRIFEDEFGKMNKNIIQANVEALSISQFTLSWDGKKGNRPSFTGAMEPDQARRYYSDFNECLKSRGIQIKEGVFGADMKVESINDGPVTFHLSF